MAKRKKARNKTAAQTSSNSEDGQKAKSDAMSGKSRQKNKLAEGPRYCSQPAVPEIALPQGLSPARERAIVGLRDKWVNGTTLKYYFFDRDTDGETVHFTDGSQRWVTWTGSDTQKDIVRDAFDVWAAVGIGLEFEEVDNREDAQIRIGFMRGDGAWSYLGRQILDIGRNDRTMNFGWNLVGDIDTAIHEIGHTLGLPHEHQNPNAGIEWNEEAVYTSLAGPPNEWSRATTFHNIIRKIDPDTVQGSNWDPDSIMHYPFSRGMIDRPEQYRGGLTPAGGLSSRDKTWIRQFYPGRGGGGIPTLHPFQSVPLHLQPGEQASFLIEPDFTRYYNLNTLGDSDTVMVLFQHLNGSTRYLTADDDSGEDFNANIRLKLFKGDRYVVRLRLYWSSASGETAILLH